MAKSKKTTATRKPSGTSKRSNTKRGTSKRASSKSTKTQRSTGSQAKRTTKRKSTATAKGEQKSAASGKKDNKKSAEETKVTVDRRTKQDRRKGEDRRKQNVPVAEERRKIERRAKVSRRRQIDPTTCERDYSDEEVEFMNALDEYKRTSGRMFPTCSEILEVVRKLGYRKSDPLDEQPATALGEPGQKPTASDSGDELLADPAGGSADDDSPILAGPDSD